MNLRREIDLIRTWLPFLWLWVHWQREFVREKRLAKTVTERRKGKQRTVGDGDRNGAFVER
jgi:hypothetical protein